MENKKEVILTITLEDMKFKAQVYGLNQKNKTALINGFRFSQMVKLTIKVFFKFIKNKYIILIKISNTYNA